MRIGVRVRRRLTLVLAQPLFAAIGHNMTAVVAAAGGEERWPCDLATEIGSNEHKMARAVFAVGLCAVSARPPRPQLHSLAAVYCDWHGPQTDVEFHTAFTAFFQSLVGNAVYTMINWQVRVTAHPSSTRTPRLMEGERC